MAADLPADIPPLLTANHNGVPTKRLLRDYGTTNADNEERVGLAGLIQAGTSKLGDDLVASLRSSQLEKLNEFVTKFNHNKNLENQVSLIAPLSAKYGDDAVARTLVELERNADTLTPTMTNLVKKLRSEQLTDWLKNGKSVDDVFNLLKLKDDGFKLLHNRKFQVLEDYITMFNREKSADETLVKVLATGFDGDGNLVALLERAKTSVRSFNKANELETALLTKWRSDNLPLMSVWSQLKFSDDVDEALSSGKLSMFSKYVSSNYPNSEKSVLEQFTTKYGEVAVAKALVKAKKNVAMKDFATKLQAWQLEGWLASQKSADDVFNLLKIEEDGIEFMKNRNFDILGEYIKLFNSNKSPTEQTNMFRVVRNGFGGDGVLARMVTTAMKTRDRTIIATATEFEEALFQRWSRSNIKPEDVYTKILDSKEGNLEKAIVARYTEYYDELNPQVYTLIFLGALSYFIVSELKSNST
ncbi:hypothetical protein PI126_g7977 [Phytophthora idaei]|nr:hypothetical protein PI126_g7977 [Phytophthora idaei]